MNIDKKGKRTLGKSPWLERNLHERGVPVPGLRGVYLEPGGLIVLSREPEAERLDLLLHVAYAAARRSRQIAFISSLAPQAVFDELTFIHFQIDFNSPPPQEIRDIIRERAPEVKRFQLQLPRRLHALQASKQTCADLFNNIAICKRMNEPNVFIIDAAAVLSRHVMKAAQELARNARQTSDKIWVLVAPAGRKSSELLEAAAAVSLKLREPANQETAPALFIA